MLLIQWTVCDRMYAEASATSQPPKFIASRVISVGYTIAPVRYELISSPAHDARLRAIVHSGAAVCGWSNRRAFDKACPIPYCRGRENLTSRLFEDASKDRATAVANCISSYSDSSDSVTKYKE